MQKIGLKILLGWALLLPITAYSLGLGDIDVKSFLNQPLKAEISIISARPGEIDDLLVGLANRDAFARASLSRPSHLSDLKFKVIKSDDGESAVISVKTQTAVKEPVLNFLVEADWSKGKVFREFTILLDPPYFAQQAAQPAPEIKTAPKEIPPVEQPQNTVKQSEAIVNQEPVQDEVSVSNDEYVNESAITEEYSFDVSSVEAAPLENIENEESYSSESITITDGATLWSVAKTLKTDDVSMSQIMLALQRVNQDAFGRDNINNLKQGAVLRVPTQQDMADLSQRDAYVEVLNQNGLWNDYLASIGHATANSSNTQLDSSNASNESTEDDTNNSELSIVTADEGMSDKAALRSDEAVEQVTTLRKQLLLSEEEAESLKVERDELSARVKMLESELDKRSELENLVSIEDDSLATMEQSLANNDSVVSDEVVETIEEPIMEMGDDSVAIEQAEISSEDGMVSEDTAPSEETSGDEPVIVEENESSNEMDSVDSITNEMAETESNNEMAETESNNELPTVTQPPIIVSETESSSGFMDALTSNPLVQGALAIILLLVLLAVKFIKGRKDKPAKDDKLESIEDVLSEDPIDTQSGIIIPNVDDEDETPINVPQMEENQPVDDFTSTVAGVNSIDDEEDEFSKTAIISADDVPAMEAESGDEDGEQDETLDEVDVYLAYSLFDNAEELLKEKLADSPDRADYRAKLLDTYFATKNKNAFIDEASSLKNLGEKADKYWPRVQTMGFELDPSNSMFAEGEGGDISDLAIAKPEMADFDIGADGDDNDSTKVSDFDLSLDGDDTDFDLSEDNDDSELEFNLDDELSLDDNASDELPDDLGGLDFDLDDATEDSDSKNTTVDDGLEFDLSDDLSAEVATETVVLDLDDDILDISVDDIDPDINDDSLDLDLDDSEINLETTGTFNAIEDDTSAEETEIIDLNLDEEENLNVGLDDSEELSISSDDSDSLDFNLDDSDDLNIDLSDSNEEIEIIDLDSSNELEIDDSESDDILDVTNEVEETVSVSDLEVESDEIIDISSDLEKTEIVSALAVDTDDLEDDSDDELVIPDIDIEDIGDLDSEGDLDDITDIGNIEGLMLPDDVDEVATKLDLAKAFHDMGDSEGARSSLEEVLEEGNEEQKTEAQALLNEIAD